MHDEYANLKSMHDLLIWMEAGRLQDKCIPKLGNIINYILNIRAPPKVTIKYIFVFIRLITIMRN